MVGAIRKVSTGEKYVSTSLAEHLASVVQREEEPLLDETLFRRDLGSQGVVGDVVCGV